MAKIGNADLGEFSVWLSPMEDITDPPFRRICKRMGADVMVSEFISSEGLIRDASKSLKKLDFSEEERPVGIQIFGSDIDSMRRAAEVAASANPDFVDINWGCPMRKVAGKGAGSGILNDIPKMVRITEAVVKSSSIPVTVKTRLGYEEKDKPIVDIALRLQDVGIQALSIHGRTRAQMYHGQADWTLIGEVKNNPQIHIPVFGNGDITSAEVALQRKQQYPTLDGMLIGRATVGNPWIFREIKHYLHTGELLPPPTLAERIAVCKEHLLTSVEWKSEITAIYETRKHYSGYFKAIKDIKPYRIRLVTSVNLAEILEILDEIGEKCKYDLLGGNVD